MSPESQTTIRRLRVLADSYLRASEIDRSVGDFSMAAACEIRALAIQDAISEIVSMEDINPPPSPPQ